MSYSTKQKHLAVALFQITDYALHWVAAVQINGKRPLKGLLVACLISISPLFLSNRTPILLGIGMCPTLSNKWTSKLTFPGHPGKKGAHMTKF